MRLAITIGDVAGIGPEVILTALAGGVLDAEVVVFGDRAVLERDDRMLCERRAGYASQADRLVTLDAPDAPLAPDQIGVVDLLAGADVASVGYGQRDARAARLQLAALHAAVDATTAGQADAVVTAPWTKELFRLIDVAPTGHTEVLAERCQAPDHVMMLAGEVLRVALVTTHVPLAEVSRLVTAERLARCVETTAADLRRLFGIARPRIAVCGLNPHAGEQGVMGDEEADVIRPAVAALAERLPEVELSGPHPADTLFAKYRGGTRQPYDAVVCMYHDQGLIPLKLVHFGESANITLGLPIVRTSVDHGTAYDIAGRGVADAGSMRYAMELAVRLASRP